MRRAGTDAPRRPAWLAALALTLATAGGCAQLAFHEDSKVAISLRLDPSAPDPLEVTAAYKESVASIVPIAKEGTEMKAGKVLADFDVRFGASANASTSWRQDILYAAITHGMATGQAAQTLAGRLATDRTIARKIAIAHFVAALDAARLKTCASALGVAGVTGESDLAVRARVLAMVRAAQSLTTLDDIEAKLGAEFGDFRPWQPATTP